MDEQLNTIQILLFLMFLIVNTQNVQNKICCIQFKLAAATADVNWWTIQYNTKFIDQNFTNSYISEHEFLSALVPKLPKEKALLCDSEISLTECF